MEFDEMIVNSNIADLRVKDTNPVKYAVKVVKSKWSSKVYTTYKIKLYINNEVHKYDFSYRPTFMEILETYKRNITETVF